MYMVSFSFDVTFLSCSISLSLFPFSLFFLVDTIPSEFLVYRPPIANKFVASLQNVPFYYIAATNPSGDGNGTQVDAAGTIANPTAQDRYLLRVRLNNEGVLRALFLTQNGIKVNGSMLEVAYTVVGSPYTHIYIYIYSISLFQIHLQSQNFL